jgi:hypothetical protein
VCRAYRMRSEVKVLAWGPDRGNPTSRRQGRGPEFTGRLADGWLCWRASVRAGLKEAIDALWLRTRVKRHKAFLGWVNWPAAAMPGSCRSRGRIGDVISATSERLTPGGLLGPSFSNAPTRGFRGPWPGGHTKQIPSDTAGRGRALTPAKIERPDEALRAAVAVRLPASLSLHPLGGPACCPRRDARRRGLLERPGRGIECGSGVSSRVSECECGRTSETHCR